MPEAERLAIDTNADKETVDELYKLILGRSINSDEFKAEQHDTCDVRYWVKRLINSEEFRVRYLQRIGVRPPSSDFIPDAEYRTPRLGCQEIPSAVLITGSCMSERWIDILKREHPGMTIHHAIFNNASELEDISEERLKGFTFQIAQLPLRSVVKDPEYFVSTPSSNGIQAKDEIFELWMKRLEANFNALMKYKRAAGIPVFVTNFVTPQANPLGLVMPRYERSNFVHVVEQLNVALADLIKREGGVYLIDFDAIAASLGKRYVIDDMSSHLNHGSLIVSTFWPEAEVKLTPYGSIAGLYQPKVRDAVLAVFNECLSAYYTISPNRKIKIVIFDLDGTLWRGVPAECDEVVPARISEGWPLGIVEAATFLKKRGILLAIASKNEPDIGRRIWDKVYGKCLPMNNFASVKISWQSKIASVGEILKEVNLLPENCLFVDDNPVEREQVAAAFPGISVISGPIATWKRTLLWSAELQAPFITEESLTRTESIQKMAQRENLKVEMSPEEYLQSLDVKVVIDAVATVEDKKFARVYELLNKTNQFNTTGKRWTNTELKDLFLSGGRIYAATVSDRLSDYGLTAIAVRRGQLCEQMVMSCRVFGLQVEHNLLLHVVCDMEEPDTAKIAFRPTEKNGPSAKFLTSIGVALNTSDDTQVKFYRVPHEFCHGGLTGGAPSAANRAGVAA